MKAKRKSVALSPGKLEDKVKRAQQTRADVLRCAAPLLEAEAKARQERRALREEMQCESEADVKQMVQEIRAQLDAHRDECWEWLECSQGKNVQKFRSLFAGMTAQCFRDFQANSLKKKCCTMDIEGTPQEKHRAWCVAVASYGRPPQVWLLNPLPQNAELQHCIRRFGSHWTFPRAFEAFTGSRLQTGALDFCDWKKTDEGEEAMVRLFNSVMAKPRLEVVKNEIRDFVDQFSYCFHFRGDEQRFWEEDVGGKQCAVSLIDIGVVTSATFFAPIRHRVDPCVMNQAVVAVLCGAPWRPPHFAENDAQMCLDSLEGILTELEMAWRQRKPAAVGI